MKRCRPPRPTREVATYICRRRSEDAATDATERHSIIFCSPNTQSELRSLDRASKPETTLNSSQVTILRRTQCGAKRQAGGELEVADACRTIEGLYAKGARQASRHEATSSSTWLSMKSGRDRRSEPRTLVSTVRRRAPRSFLVQPVFHSWRRHAKCV